MKIQPNALDRVIGLFSPQTALNRAFARARFEALSGTIAAGDTSRTQMSNWVPYGYDADSATMFKLPLVRARANELVMNDPLAAGAINTNVTSTIGSGLNFHSRLDRETLGIDDEEAAKRQNLIEREFRHYCERECDITRTNTFWQLQGLVLRSTLVNGDTFAVLPMVKRPGSVYSTRIQIVEADRVCNKDNVANSETLIEGIELDQHGAPKSYHIRTTHPGSMFSLNGQWRVIPAFGGKTGRRNVLHIFDRRRPGQNRGISYLAPVIEKLKQLGRYSDAELTAAVVSGMFSVFLKTPDGAGFNDAGVSAGEAQTGRDVLNLEPGAIISLAPGEEPVGFNPGRPSTAFDPFVLSILRQIGVALELPLEVLIAHFTSSYSAARASLLMAWRYFKSRREWLVSQFCDPVFEAWMDEAVAMGRIPAPGYFQDPRIRSAYLGSEWTGDAMGSINPQQEAAAAQIRLETGISDYSREIAEESGRDWETVFAQRAIEAKRIKQLGLDKEFGPGAQAAIAAEKAKAMGQENPNAKLAEKKPKNDGGDE